MRVKFLLSISLVFLWLGSLSAQHTHPPLPNHLENEISAERILTQIRDFASPGFEGRELGEPGNHKAADWISFTFSNHGLSPLPGEDGFFHPFNIHRLSLSEDSFLIIDNDSIDMFEKFTATHYSGNGQFSGEAINVSWGNHHDVAHEDVSGHVVTVQLKEKEDLKTGRFGIHPAAIWADSLDADGLILIPESYSHYIEQAYRFEPQINLPQDAQKHIGNTAQPFVKEKRVDIPVLVASEQYFQKSDYEPALIIDALVELQIEQTGLAHNVAGYLGEFEPDTPYIIVSAFFDGHGFQSDSGIPFFGANRNASGVSVLLELARSLKTVEEALEYPVIFAAWNGHERFNSGIEHFFSSVWKDHENLMSYINLSELSAQQDTSIVEIFGLTEESPVHPHIAELAEKYEIGYSYQPIDPLNNPEFLLPSPLSTEIIGLNGGEYSYSGRIHDSPDKINLRQVYDISLFSLELIWNLSTLYEPL